MRKQEKQELARRINTMLCCFKQDELMQFIESRMESAIEEDEWTLDDIDLDLKDVPVSPSTKAEIKLVKKNLKERRSLLKEFRKLVSKSSKLTW